MKRILSIMLVLGLMLSGIALADVQSRIIAPEHLETTIKSKTGKTEIIIDAAVEVPSVSKAPVFSVLPMPVPAENVVALADELLGPGLWMGQTEYMPDNYAANTDGTVTQASDSISILSFEGQKILLADAKKLNGSYHGKLQLLRPDQTWNRWSSERDLPYDAMSESYAGANNQYERSTWNVSLPRPEYSAYVTLSNMYIVGLLIVSPMNVYLSISGQTRKRTCFSTQVPAPAMWKLWGKRSMGSL